MKTRKNMQTVRRRTADATIPGRATPRPSTIPKQPAEFPVPTPGASQFNRDGSEQFSENIRRRSQTPEVPSWRHGGLND